MTLPHNTQLTPPQFLLIALGLAKDGDLRAVEVAAAILDASEAAGFAKADELRQVAEVAFSNSQAADGSWSLSIERARSKAIRLADEAIQKLGLDGYVRVMRPYGLPEGSV